MQVRIVRDAKMATTETHFKSAITANPVIVMEMPIFMRPIGAITFQANVWNVWEILEVGIVINVWKVFTEILYLDNVKLVIVIVMDPWAGIVIPSQGNACAKKNMSAGMSELWYGTIFFYILK